MRKRNILILAAVIFLVIGILYIVPSPKEEEVIPNPKNTELYTLLANVGIEDALVDITKDRALIRYELPENMSKEASQYYIMLAAATITNSSKIVIQVYENFTPLEEVVVSTDDVLAFMNGTITYEEFEKRIKIKSLK